MNAKDFFKGANFFYYLMMSIGQLLLLSVLFIVIKGEPKVVDAIVDFLAYALPIVAGALAGGGIYFKDDSEFYFGWSCAALLAGFAAYMQTKQLGDIFCMASLLLVVSWIAVDLWVAVDEIALRHSTIGLVIWICKRVVPIVIGLSVVLWLFQRMHQ